MANNLLKSANVVVFLFFVLVTGYALFSKDVIADIFQGYETYFDPARWMFLVWSLIHLLLLCFVAYQWTSDGEEAVVNGVGWHFVVAALLNSLWFSLLESHHPILGFIVSILLLVSVSVTFYNLAENFAPETWGQRFFVHSPFSVWHGFTIFMAVWNAFVAFATVRKDQLGIILHPNVFHVILVYAALIFLTLSAIGYVQYKHERCDITSAWVIAFCLWAVFDHQRDPLIHWPALAAALVSTIWPIEPFVYHMVKYRTIHSEESERILNSTTPS
ncbi:hypothetical protein K492DRAFT_174176 [Lichtheimia hyalospora FSU 10163]|nr:hypothetical protein K492DRAFT_174176 [Lichtheimia hyalospora FSU 10163]